MANEVQVDGPKGLGSGWFLMWNAVGQVADPTQEDFVSYSSGNLDNYDMALTEKGSLGTYHGSIPSWVPVGIYKLTAYYSSVAESAPRLGDGVVHWNGSALIPLSGVILASTGLDNIPTTAPTGVASTFREMLVQTWRRFFKKSTLGSGILRTYDDGGSTPLTSQSVTDDGSTQTQGAAS